MIMGLNNALSLVLLIDKIRGNKGENLLRYLPPDYIEKLNLQIPENLRKLLSDVILVLLEKSGIDRREAEKYAEKLDRKEHSGMFEAVIESIIEGREEARKEGLKEGREEGIETAARRALAEGATLEFVQKITGFDIETIKNIASESTTPPQAGN
jgi:predicted transposase/invertase (TIGR01784 family)